MMLSNVTLAQQRVLDLTLYTSDFGIVHDKRELQLEDGVNEITLGDLPRTFNPETVYVEFEGRILEQSHDMGSGNWAEDIYKRLRGKEIRLISESGEVIEGTLQAHQYGQLIVEDRDGAFVYLSNAGNYRLHTEEDPSPAVQTQMHWTLESEQGGVQPLSLYYQVSQMQWSSGYLLILEEDEETMTLENRATIINRSGMDFPDVRVRLVAGAPDVSEPKGYTMARSGMMAEDRESSSIGPESFFEYYVFELPGRIHLADQEQKQVALHRAAAIPALKHYRYATGSVGQVNRNNNNSVRVEFRLTNNEDFKLGRPLPGGLVKAYQKNDELMEFIGEDRLEHTPAGQDFTLSAGRAFDVTAEEKQIRLEELSPRVREEEREITFTSRKEKDITVEVHLQLYQNEELTGSSIPAREVEARRYVFEVPVTGEAESTLTLQLRRSN
ncbi:MAG: DUF4139 domain-containing protein [Balneolales bacterium]